MTDPRNDEIRQRFFLCETSPRRCAIAPLREKNKKVPFQ